MVGVGDAPLLCVRLGVDAGDGDVGGGEMIVSGMELAILIEKCDGDLWKARGYLERLMQVRAGVDVGPWAGGFREALKEVNKLIAVESKEG
jgi:hypothetical protein